MLIKDPTITPDETLPGEKPPAKELLGEKLLALGNAAAVDGPGPGKTEAEGKELPVETELRAGVQRPMALRYLDTLRPAPGTIPLRNASEILAECDALSRLGVEVNTIGASRDGRPIQSMKVGSGPVTIVMIAGAHPDEPVGANTCLHLMRQLQTDRRLKPLLELATFHAVPMANPDGTVRNETWFKAWEKEPKLTDYMRGVQRDPPKDDVEFGFPQQQGGSARPENAALAGWFDGLGHINHYVSLHSMFLGGGALFLAMADDLGEQSETLRFVLDHAAREGMPLHDKDRRGQKGFHRVCPGLQTAPTREAMAEFFAKGGRKDVADRFKLNSMQYVQKYNGCPLAMVSEIPLSFDPKLSDPTPAGMLRRDEELNYAAGIESLLLEAKDLGEQLGGLVGDGPGRERLERYEASLESGQAAVSAMRQDLDRYGDMPATRGNLAENHLNLLRRRATYLGKALSVIDGLDSGTAEGVRDRTSFRERTETALDDIYAQIETDFDLNHPSVEAQVGLQLAAVLSGVCV